MSITEIDDDCTPLILLSQEKTKSKGPHWYSERIFRLGVLVGMGWGAKRIASDPLINSTPKHVNYKVCQLGGGFRDVRGMSVVLRQSSAEFYDAEASRRGLRREKLIQVLLEEIAADKTLFDNIMDDGERL